MEIPQNQADILVSLKQLHVSVETKINQFFDKYGNSDFRLTVITVVLIILTGGDALLIVHNKFIGTLKSPVWQYLEKKSHNILTTQTENHVFDHVSKMVFRLTAPMLAKLCFGCNLYALSHFLVILDYIAGFFFIYLFVKFLKRCTADIVTVRFLTISLGCIFLGKIFFWDRGDFDGFALATMLIGMMSYSLPVQILTFSVALWTDERAFLAMPLIWFWYLINTGSRGGGQVGSEKASSIFVLKKGHLAITIAVVLALIGRFILIHYYNFPTRVTFEGMIIEAIIILKYGRVVNLAPLTLFSAFESLWLIIVLGIYSLWHNRQKAQLVFLLLASSISIGAAFLVADVARSIVYGFPLLIIAIRLVSNTISSDKLHKLSFYIMLFAVIFPTYCMGDYLFPFFIKAFFTREVLK